MRPTIRQSGGLPWLLLAVLSLWLAGEAAEAGLLEKVNTAVNSVVKKTDMPQLDPLPCIHTDRSGVVPCDNNPKCCQKDSPRIAGTDYCCPPGSSQYHFLNMEEVVCACAV